MINDDLLTETLKDKYRKKEILQTTLLQRDTYTCMCEK